MHSSVLLLLLALLPGCASQASVVPPAKADVSSALAAFAGFSADYDPYATPDEMARAVNHVIEGRIGGFHEGRELVVTGTGQFSASTMVMVIDGVSVLKEGGDEQIKSTVYVELPNPGEKTPDEYNKLIPSGTPVLAYLDPAWDGSDPADEALKDATAGRPAGESLYMLDNPQSLVLQVNDRLVWPLLGEHEPGTLDDARPDGSEIAK